MYNKANLYIQIQFLASFHTIANQNSFLLFMQNTNGRYPEKHKSICISVNDT